MWCANCQAEVAAEVASNNRVRCASCGSEISPARPVQAAAGTDEARELLRRWAADELLDPFGPLPHTRAPRSETNTDIEPPSDPGLPDRTDERRSAGPEQPDKGPTVPAEQAAKDQPVASSDASASLEPDEPPVSRERSHPRGPNFRLDSAHGKPGRRETRSEEPAAAAPTTNREPSGNTIESSAGTAGSPSEPSFETPAEGPQASWAEPARETEAEIAHGRRIHSPHGEAAPAPHFDVQAAIEDDRAGRGNWSTFIGQILAYFGVAGLTVGTALVLWGYFGGPASYTPTGWLLATAGQMLLFLGVVTLVSGGMEQTTAEVARRIDRLGERLIRIEQSSRGHALRGPHFMVRRGRPSDSDSGAPGSRDRETAHSGH